jgi:hypothetical protein
MFKFAHIGLFHLQRGTEQERGRAGPGKPSPGPALLSRRLS